MKGTIQHVTWAGPIPSALVHRLIVLTYTILWAVPGSTTYPFLCGLCLVLAIQDLA